MADVPTFQRLCVSCVDITCALLTDTNKFQVDHVRGEGSIVQGTRGWVLQCAAIFTGPGTHPS